MQVLACFPADSKSLNELEPQLRQIMENYEKIGEKYVEGQDAEVGL